MSSASRRTFLSSSAAGLVSACGGGGSVAQDPTSTAESAFVPPVVTPPVAPPSVVVPPVVTPPVAVVGRYRSTQPYLFQSVPAKTIPRRLPTGTDYLWDVFGPTNAYVDFQTGWRWTQAGGDWLDANRVRQGGSPWFSIAADKVQGSALAASYSGDVTSALQFVQSTNRWCAFLLNAKNAPRKLAGIHHPTHAAPSLDVTYADGRHATLACRIVAGNSAGSTSPMSADAEYTLPVFIEFERPDAAVATARLNYVLTQHWSGANPAVVGFVLDPGVTADSTRAGLAAGVGRLDEGIQALPAVIGAHRYLDGTTLDEFAHAGERNYSNEANHDPAIFGTGPTDLGKFPHVGLGKWINADPSWSLVPSSYRGEGFQPLASGLGAMRIRMPAQPGVQDGSTVGYGGTLAGNGMIFLPEPLFGRLGRIFVRYYFRLGSPLTPTSQKRYQVYNTGTSADWTSFSGKFGIGPDHSTSYGGVSGTSGGGSGWQMRLLWSECDAGQGGPDEGGWAPGFHLYDYYYQNPPGYNYGQESSASERWGQRGGLGGMLYADRWYCIETELRLNTVMTTGAGFVPDGELRAWVDGRLVYERTAMVFRTLPLAAAGYLPGRMRPCRELGVRGLWLNWFHGGKTVATIDRTSFYTGLVWSKEYVGLMKV